MFIVLMIAFVAQAQTPQKVYLKYCGGGTVVHRGYVIYVDLGDKVIRGMTSYKRKDERPKVIKVNVIPVNYETGGFFSKWTILYHIELTTLLNGEIKTEIIQISHREIESK